MSRKKRGLKTHSPSAEERNLRLTVESKEKARQESDRSSRAFIVLGLMISAVFVIGVIAARRGNNPTSAPAALPLASPPAMPSNNPSKEYVYAGSALLATTEPFHEPPDDIAVWRPSATSGSSTWFIYGARSQTITSPFAAGTFTPVPADYDGDGKTDFCVFQSSSGQWYIVKSSDGTSYTVSSGVAGNVAVAHDYDGDGRADIASYNPSTHVWHITRSSSNVTTDTAFGEHASDMPEPADFDGDGKADLTVWRGATATFYVLKSSDSQMLWYSIGQTGDEPAVGDYDGDGRADYATLRVNGDYYWRIQYSSTGTLGSIQWGTGGDIAVQGNYSDGDAKTDIAIWRPGNGTWYIRKSTDGSQRTVQLGQSGDTPVPAPFKRGK